MRKKKQEDLSLRLVELGVHAGDLEEKFIIGTGPGGQNLQKTASCVWLKHLPSGVEIKCQKSRRREENRLLARLLLCEVLEKKRQEKELEQKAIIAKKRREKRRRSFIQKEKLVAQKRKISEKKSFRKAPKNGD